jgi:hypothetical protein
LLWKRKESCCPLSLAQAPEKKENGALPPETMSKSNDMSRREYMGPKSNRYSVSETMMFLYVVIRRYIYMYEGLMLVRHEVGFC